MSILDALPGIALGAFGSMFHDATLTKTSGRTPDGRGGTIGGMAAATPCKALVDTFSDVRKALAGIPDDDRRITVLGASLGGVIPAVGDTIAVEGRTWSVVGVGRDPAGATYELQGR